MVDERHSNAIYETQNGYMDKCQSNFSLWSFKPYQQVTML